MTSKLPGFALAFVVGAMVFSAALGATIVAAFAQATSGSDSVVGAAVDLVCSNAQSVKWLVGALGTSVGCSAIVALTKTPDSTTVAGKIYRVIETIALVVGRTKEVAKPGLGAVAVTLALVLSACGATGMAVLSGAGAAGGAAGGAVTVVSQVNKDVPTAYTIGCAALKGADDLFGVVSPALVQQGKLTQADLAQEKTIMATASLRCANPPTDLATAGKDAVADVISIYAMIGQPPPTQVSQAAGS